MRPEDLIIKSSTSSQREVCYDFIWNHLKNQIYHSSLEAFSKLRWKFKSFSSRRPIFIGWYKSEWTKLCSWCAYTRTFRWSGHPAWQKVLHITRCYVHLPQSIILSSINGCKQPGHHYESFAHWSGDARPQTNVIRGSNATYTFSKKRMQPSAINNIPNVTWSIACPSNVKHLQWRSIKYLQTLWTVCLSADVKNNKLPLPSVILMSIHSMPTNTNLICKVYY